jgi:hypothetical protein
MSNKTTLALIAIAALAFGAAAVNGTFNTVSDNQAAERETNRASLSAEIQDKYDVKLTTTQLDEIMCDDGIITSSCYSGPTEEMQSYGTTQYEKADGSKIVTIQLISTFGGIGLVERDE